MKNLDLYNPQRPRVIRWVIKYSGGSIKDEKTATLLLLGLVGIMLVLTVYFLFNLEKSSQSVDPDKIPLEQR